jgi:hypothetical protein
MSCGAISILGSGDRSLELVIHAIRVSSFNMTRPMYNPNREHYQYTNRFQYVSVVWLIAV